MIVIFLLNSLFYMTDLNKWFKYFFGNVKMNFKFHSVTFFFHQTKLGLKIEMLDYIKKFLKVFLPLSSWTHLKNTANLFKSYFGLRNSF